MISRIGSKQLPEPPTIIASTSRATPEVSLNLVSSTAVSSM